MNANANYLPSETFENTRSYNFIKVSTRRGRYIKCNLFAFRVTYQKGRPVETYKSATACNADKALFLRTCRCVHIFKVG